MDSTTEVTLGDSSKHYVKREAIVSRACITRMGIAAEYDDWGSPGPTTIITHPELTWHIATYEKRVATPLNENAPWLFRFIPKWLGLSTHLPIFVEVQITQEQYEALADVPDLSRTVYRN